MMKWGELIFKSLYLVNLHRILLAKTLFFRYELWKPYLRSMMEADMKSVSMGTKSKSEVLQSCLQQMKACFLDVSSKFFYCLI
jgi:hypothetical protein